MARRREVGIIKACVLGVALAVGLGTAAQAGDNKLSFTGSAVDHDGLYVPQHFQHEQEAGGAGRIRCDLRHVLGLYVGIQYRFWR